MMRCLVDEKFLGAAKQNRSLECQMEGFCVFSRSKRELVCLQVARGMKDQTNGSNWWLRLWLVIAVGGQRDF